MSLAEKNKTDVLWDRLVGLYRRIEDLPSRRPEATALALYIALMIVVMCFHEPWFDEAQAWMIARCATLREILTVIPHYEGHPPLWHLLLLPLAKGGVPYELGLKSVSLLLCSVSMGLLIFKSPFPRVLRLAIPFTYFCFYQYGVISRPYSLMMLGFVLMALSYRERNDKPFRFVAAMALVCGSNAYGIVLCAGVCLVWLFEIWNKRNIFVFLRQSLRDKRIYGLFLLLLVVLCFIAIILPYDNTYASQLVSENSLFDRIVYMLLIAPADSVLYSCFFQYGLLSSQAVWGLNFVVGILVGILFWSFVIGFASGYHKILLLILPYTLFALFAANVYFYTHHLGITALYLLFWFWVVLDTSAVRFSAPNFLLKLASKDTDIQILKRLSLCMLAACVFISLFWSATATVSEIIYPYGYGRELSGFLKDSHLKDAKILSSWRIVTDLKDNSETVDTNSVSGVDLLPYFSHNIIFNLNGGNDRYAYLRHIAADDDENAANYERWAEHGVPDVIIGFASHMDDVYGKNFSMSSYMLADYSEFSYIWKNTVQTAYIPLYVRRDLADKLGLKAVTPISFGSTYVGSPS